MGAIAQLRRQVIADLLEQEDYILILVDTRCPGIMLPENLLRTKQPVALHIGHRLKVPIPDLKLDDEALSGTLSFNREPFSCAIPWTCILQVSVGDEHLVWVCPRPREEAPIPSRERPKLRLV